MHRVDGQGATVDNLFTEGDPGSGVPATTVTADILNALQEEMCSAIEGAGIALDKQDNTQLLAALQALASAATGWTTGDAKATLKTAADTGWIMADDGTIGASGSAGTNRANDDCEALFKLLWNNIGDTYAPVGGGRGASAQEDWDAGKVIQVGTLLGRALGVAGAGSGLTARALGEVVGEEDHLLTLSEMPQHYHTWDDDTGGSGARSHNDSSGNYQHVSESGNTGPAGGDAAHNNMQPTAFLNVMIKL